MRSALVIMVALLAACGVDADVGARTFALAGDVDEHRDDLERAATAWADLDFALVSIDESPDVVITIEVEHLYTLYGTANQDTATVTLDPALWSADTSERARLGMIAHEVGHVLLQAGHLTGDRTGVMRPGGGYVVTADDRWLACESIGRCL